MKKRVNMTIYVTTEIEIPDTEDVLKSYREVIDTGADYEDLFAQVAHVYMSESAFVEGIGREEKDFIVLSWDDDYEYEFEEI